MESLIQVFRMTEISAETRIKLIKKLGEAINFDLGGNYTQPLVYELVLALDKNNEIKDDQRYTKFL